MQVVPKGFSCDVDGKRLKSKRRRGADQGDEKDDDVYVLCGDDGDDEDDGNLTMLMISKVQRSKIRQ